MRLLLLLVIIGYTFAVSAQPAFDLTSTSIENKLGSEYSFLEKIAPANEYEKKVLQKADSCMIAYLKDYRATKTYYKDAWLSSYFNQGGTVRFKDIEKFLDVVPIDEYALSGTWSSGLDTLYIWGLSNVYKGRFDVLEGYYRPFTMQLFNYAQFMPTKDYTAFINIIQDKTKQALRIVTDTVNDADIVQVSFKRDSTVLPQAPVQTFARKISNACQEGSCTAYSDYYLQQVLSVGSDPELGRRLDTIPIEHIKNIDSLVAAAAAVAYVPDRILATEEWNFYTLPTIKGLPQINFQYGFIGVRKKVSLGIVPTTGIKNAAFVSYDEFKQHMNYRNKHGFDPFEQSIEALFYKKYNVLNIYDDEW